MSNAKSSVVTTYPTIWVSWG